ncbi:competence protein CoiA family protein [Nocardiopsis valliformis]|uniref:competence protein CoiA family protein n=1 Tax=Nocardiopsis valliformis TaxID=239974 RepID=UPI00034D4CA2|nr:hypothetical protein [Nocardiopsis valliformis]
MAQELALIRWTETGIILDPNHDDFDVAPTVIHALRGAPGGPRRTIKVGVLECQRCVEINRSSTSVYLRRRGDRLTVAHHKSDEGPCYQPEGPEHLAWKERIATDAERAGFTAVMESSTKDRSIRSDVVIIGAQGQEVAWEVQMSRIRAPQVLKRSHSALRQGRSPSWLTTDRRAGSPTRALINRAPWSMVTQIVPEQIRMGRAARVVGGLRNFAWQRCIELPGRCPESTGIGGWTYDCGDWHGSWEKVTVPVEDFVGKTAAGLYVPIAVPGVDHNSVMRMWVRPEDHEAYAHERGRRFTEQDLPEHLRIATPPPRAPAGTRRARSKESKLHTTRKGGTGMMSAEASMPVEAELAEQVHLPVLTRQAPPTDLEVSAGVDEVDAWFQVAVAEPCSRYLGSQERMCSASPTRLYPQGRRCFEHAPNAFTTMP